jgi:coenzyme F420-reducing hydrogenase alpha subunit
MEQAFGAKVDGQLRALRRLIYCGEWIESHVLHVYMLHAPDFLGFEDAIQIAQVHPEIVKKALELKKIGNELMILLGGREIHPINVKVGGFYKTPTQKELRGFLKKLKWAQEAAYEMIQFAAGLPFPDIDRDYEFVALRHPDEYPFNEGRVVSNKGLDISIDEYEIYFEEEHIKHANALHSRLKGKGAYFTGPLARYNLNFDQLYPDVQKAALKAGLKKTCTNPFKGIIVRAVETAQVVEDAIRIIEKYEQPAQPSVEIQPRSGRGCGCSEAPRGILYHRYTLDDRGVIQTAKIVPPTAQNQKMIESDLREVATRFIDLPQEELTLKCEQAVRNYDPCISCATHFLKLTVERT